MSQQTLNALFSLCMANYRQKRAGRLQGRHCKARLLRAQTSRKAAGKTVYQPWREGK